MPSVRSRSERECSTWNHKLWLRATRSTAPRSVRLILPEVLSLMLSARAYLLGILSWPCLRTSRRGRSSVRARDWITEGLRHCRSASGVDRGMDRANRPQQRQRPVASLAPTVTWAHWGGLAGGPMSLPAASACPPLAGTGGVWRAHVSFWPRTRWGPRTTCAPTAASDDASLSAHQLLNSWLFHVEHLQPPCACFMRTPHAHDRPERYPTRFSPDRPSGHIPPAYP